MTMNKCDLALLFADPIADCWWERAERIVGEPRLTVDTPQKQRWLAGAEKAQLAVVYDVQRAEQAASVRAVAHLEDLLTLEVASDLRDLLRAVVEQPAFQMCARTIHAQVGYGGIFPATGDVGALRVRRGVRELRALTPRSNDTRATATTAGTTDS